MGALLLLLQLLLLAPATLLVLLRVLLQWLVALVLSSGLTFSPRQCGAGEAELRSEGGGSVPRAAVRLRAQ